MSGATLKQELTSHQKNPTKKWEKKKNHHRLKVVGVLGEKSDRSHQNAKPQLKPSGGNYLGGGFFSNICWNVPPRTIGEDDFTHFGRLAYFFQDGLWVGEKTTEAAIGFTLLNGDRPKTQTGLCMCLS